MITKILRALLLAFAAGCAGGLANGFIVWLFGYLHITAILGVNLAPDFTLAWLYPRIVWGGIWGFLFLLPVLSGTYLARGLLLSIGPSIGQLFIVFPALAQGYLGIKLGILTPLFVLIFNAVWGIVGIYLYQGAKGTKAVKPK